jgi:type II secretory pathway pseudopilin PulG
LVAVVILSIAITALVGGLLTGVLSSEQHRRAATADTVVRSYAESLQVAVSQRPQSTWCSSTPYTVVYTKPSGYNVSQTPGPCPAGPPAPQFQAVTITAFPTGTATTDGNGQKLYTAAETLTVVVRQP